METHFVQRDATLHDPNKPFANAAEHSCTDTHMRLTRHLLLLFSSLAVACTMLHSSEPLRKPDFASGPQIDQPTGFFHTKKVNGRWWIVDPNGRAFYSIGTDHINFNGHHCEALGYAPYGRNAKAKYGTEEKWIETQQQRLTAWGFNTLPYATDGLKLRNLAHIETLSLGTSFSDTDSLSPKTTWTGLPNVFNPEWPKHCDRAARERCAKLKDDPWVLGYFLDNELEWFSTDEPVGLFGATWRRAAGDSAKEAWLKFLREELGDVRQFEKHWGVRVASFEELARHQQPVPPRTKKGQAIALNFVREIAERYFRTCAEAIHRYDPNHLILGCRFASRAPAIWDIAGRHCEIVTFNYYKWIDVERGVPVELVREMTDWYAQTQKPMMLTEWSFPALDAGLPSIWGGGMRVDTQAQRTQCFNHFQSVLFALPFMVGSSWFMYIDEPAQGISKTFPEVTNYGLIDVNDEPYPELTAAATRLNSQVYAMHAKGEIPPLARKGKLAKWVTDARPAKSAAPPEHLKLTSGTLSLEGPVDGHAWRLREGNVLLGDLFAYFQQDTEGWLLVPTDAARIVAVQENRHATVVDMELSSEGKGPVITRLTVDYSRPGAKNLRPCNYRGVWRFVIPRATGGWISMQCLWFENTDSLPWTAVQSYYFLMPTIGGETRDDIPLYAPDLHAYWLTGAAWVDKTVGTGVGCWFLQDSKIECTYWVDAKGRYRSDMRYELKERLAPGQRWTTPGPPAFFFPLQGATRKDYEQSAKSLTEQVVVGGGSTKPTRASVR